MSLMECNVDAYLVSTDQSRLDLKLIHQELNRTYWAQGIPFETMKMALENSLCFAAYDRLTGLQVGFGRTVTDYSTFAYLSDFFVLPEHRGKGISKLLVKCVLAHPKLQGLRRICLATLDAHSLYGQFGFNPTNEPQNWMEIKNENIYRKKT